MDYTKKLVISEKQYETKDEYYRLTYNAEVEYVHEDCVMYYKDGSGYPGCDDLDIEKIEIIETEIYNPATRDFEPFKPVKEQISVWEEEIEEFLQNADLDEWDNWGDDYDTCKSKQYRVL